MPDEKVIPTLDEIRATFEAVRQQDRLHEPLPRRDDRRLPDRPARAGQVPAPGRAGRRQGLPHGPHDDQQVRSLV